MNTLTENELREIDGGDYNDDSNRIIYEWRREIMLEWMYYILGRAAR